MNMKMRASGWLAVAMLGLLVMGCGQAQDQNQNSQARNAQARNAQAGNGQSQPTPTAAAPGKLSAGDAAALAARLEKELPGMKGATITPSVVPGLYQVAKGALIGYISADGKYLIEGDLMEIATRHNLTEEARGEWRRKQLASLNEKDMIIYEPEQVKHTITVFTDVECPYCRRLQAHMPEMLKRGIRVRYLFMPVHGPKSVKEAGWVWCAKDRKQAFEDAMRGGKIQQADCKNPVEAQMRLGGELGVRGTPGIITDSGELLRGYMPPDALLSELNRRKQDS